MSLNQDTQKAITEISRNGANSIFQDGAIPLLLKNPKIVARLRKRYVALDVVLKERYRCSIWSIIGKVKAETGLTAEIHWSMDDPQYSVHFKQFPLSVYLKKKGLENIFSYIISPPENSEFSEYWASAFYYPDHGTLVDITVKYRKDDEYGERWERLLVEMPEIEQVILSDFEPFLNRFRTEILDDYNNRISIPVLQQVVEADPSLLIELMEY